MPVDAVTDLHDEDDHDSLFGSPPPSPGRGRSPSPLALPGGSGSDATQNVGTLALPGSQLFSELPSVLSAPPVTCPPATAPESQQRHAQKASSARAATVSAKASTSSAGGGSATRSNSPAPAPRASRAQKKSSKRAHQQSSSSTPRPEGPKISLPNPSDPPPSNFLRNQQALLGLAGLVSGIKPADLANRHNRGSTPSNPIVVEDEDETPTIGKNNPAGSVPHHSVNVPMPSGQDILQTLVNQKNIFPVIDALLRLAARTSEGQPQQYSAFQRRGNEQPPNKKRKLNTVPAGAADWDVPYPFAAGQGPSDYRTNWERERGKQLIGDLIALVKSAARKAAAKNLYQTMTIQQQQQIWEQKYGMQPRVYGHYRPDTLNYGLPPGQSAVPPMFHPSSVHQPFPSGPVPPPPYPQYYAAAPYPYPYPPQAYYPAPPYMYPPPQQNDTPASSSSTASAFNAFDLQSTSTSSNEPTQQYPNDLDEFLALFNDMPQSELEEIFSAPAFTDQFGPTSESAAPTTEKSETDQQEGSSGAASESIAGPSGSSESTTQPSVDQSVYDHDPALMMIDPALVALSFPQTTESSASEFPPQDPSSVPPPQQPQISVHTHRGSITSTSNGNTGPPTPTLVGSPLSLSSPDPQTPHWETTFPDVEIAGSSGGNEEGHGHGRSTGDADVEMRDGTGACLGSMFPSRSRLVTKVVRFADDADGSGSGSGTAKGKEVMREFSPSIFDGPSTVGDSQVTSREQSAVPNSTFEPFVSPVPSSAMDGIPSTSQLPPNPTAFSPTPTFPMPPLFTGPSVPYMHTPFFTTPGVQVAQALAAVQPKPKVRNREDIIRRARAMRAKLVDEIERAKVAMWETTMESGLLTLLAKDKSLGS
ncbi:hypothetical protein K474DRAFT_811121 [Panus rudis PR-1116 ss-1]|nr:hypothetical protein K474DRAFT_811121 [Panus rudis PR-1116 ss-1]